MYLSPEQNAEALKATGNSGNIKDRYIQLNPDANNETVTSYIRLVGLPLAVERYRPFKKPSGGDKDARPIPCDFPDKDAKKKFYRYGAPPSQKTEFEDTIWRKMGYDHGTRWIQNVIELQEGGTYTVKLLEKTKTCFQEFQKAEDANRKRNQMRGSKQFCEWLGGPDGSAGILTAKFNPLNENNPTISFSPDPEVYPILEEHVQALKTVGSLKPEELEEIFSKNPTLRSLPEWVWYGFPLFRIYKWDTLNAATPDTDIHMSPDSNDDHASAPATAPATAGKGGKSGKAAAAPATHAEPEAAEAGGSEDEPDW